MRSKREGKPIIRYVIGFILFLATMTTLYPIINLLAVSLTGSKHIASVNGLTILPKGFTLDTYIALLSNNKVAKGLLNSIFITSSATAINVLLTSMTAYALSRKHFVGKRLIIIFIIITMIFNGGLIPNYMLIKQLHLIDKYWAVILPGAINVYYLIILVKFYESIPESILEAAKIDGANHLQILFKIIMPLSKAAIATITLFYAVLHWNEYFNAMIYLNNPDKWPIQVVLRQFIIDSDKAAMVGIKSLTEYSGAAMLSMKSLKAGITILTMLPILAFYPIILRYFTKGSLDGGIKQ